MKRIILLSGLLLGLTTLSAYSQDSLRVQPSLPQGQYGSPANTGEEHIQKEDRVEVEKSMLPPVMKEELTKNSRYKGWEDVPVYYEQNVDQYLLHISSGNTTQTYRFDKGGRPITTDKPTEEEEQKQ
jgi:hypothetical protein